MKGTSCPSNARGEHGLSILITPIILRLLQMSDMSSKFIFVVHVQHTMCYIEQVGERPPACRLAFEDSSAFYLIKSHVTRVTDGQYMLVRNVVINKSIELGVMSTLRDVRAQKKKEMSENKSALPFDELPLWSNKNGEKN